MGDTVAIRVDGLAEFRAGLRGIDAAWAKELNAINKAISKAAANDATAEAIAMGGVYAKAASSIRPMGPYALTARIGIGGANRGLGNASFWGMLARSGWNAGWRNGVKTGRRNIEGAAPQHPKWVGSAWDTAVAGQGPHVLNDALAHNLDHYLDMFSEALVDLAARAAFH